MTACHRCLSVKGEQIGDLISVGARVTLYTVRPELGHLDGVTFDSAEEAEAEVVSALEAAAYGATLALQWPAQSEAFPPIGSAELRAHDPVD